MDETISYRDSRDLSIEEVIKQPAKSVNHDFYCECVLTGRVPVSVVRETGNVLAFHHTQPYWPVHVVIIPKRHIESLATLTPSDLPIVHEMLEIAADITRDILTQHGGCRLSTNAGSFQDTKHLHFYIHSGARLRDEKGRPVAPLS